jgi:hypothetical protein
VASNQCSKNVDKPPPLVDYSAVGTYAYELRRGDEILSTGRLTFDHRVSPGDKVTVAGVVAELQELSWTDREPRLILEATRAIAGSST